MMSNLLKLFSSNQPVLIDGGLVHRRAFALFVDKTDGSDDRDRRSKMCSTLTRPHPFGHRRL